MGFLLVLMSDYLTDILYLSCEIAFCISRITLAFFGGAVRLKLISATSLAAIYSLAPYLNDTPPSCLMEITLLFENRSCESSLLRMNRKLGPDRADPGFSQSLIE